MGPRLRRRWSGVLVVFLVVGFLTPAAPAAAADDQAEASAAQVRAFLAELFANDPGQPGQWEWEPAPPAAREVRFPSGETLPVVSGAVGPGEEHHDPSGSGLPLLDVSGEHRSTRLAADFTAGEFAHSDGQRLEVARIDPALVACLQDLRDSVGRGVRVDSGYRPSGGDADDAGERSYWSGRAVDITVEGMSAREVTDAVAAVCGCEPPDASDGAVATVDVGFPGTDCQVPDAADTGMTPGGLLAAPATVLEDLREALRSGDWPAAVGLAVAHGLRDEDQLTDMVFFVSHPELRGRRLLPGERELALQWLAMRDDIARPAVQAFHGWGVVPPPPADGPVRSSSWLRQAWAGHECGATAAMAPIEVLGHRTMGHPWAADAFAALDGALQAAGYRATSVGNYNCRDIRGQPGTWSLHAYGLAVDIDPACHPHRVGDPGPARLSTKPTQEERCRDVRAGHADTAFTPAQIRAVEAIRTVDGHRVFTWGGRWQRSPDAMHFQINVSPAELRRGIASAPQA